MRELDEAAITAEPAHPRQAEDSQVPAALLGRAAAAGRPEAVGVHGMLRLQREVGNAGASSLVEEERSAVHDVVSSGGEELDRGTRGQMEAALGHDFSDVRVHRDSAAHDSAAAVQAKAYTVGSHVVFQRDAYDPSSAEGRHTLAHELSHVVQQRSGPVDGTDAPGGIRVSDPSDRFEREASQVADRVTSAPAPTGPAASSGPGGAIQREEQPEEEVQTYVQRQEEPEEEVQTYVQRDADLPASVQRDEETEAESEE